MKSRILIVDDEPGIRFGARSFLETKGYEIEEAESVAEADQKVQGGLPDAIVLDFKLGDGTALDLLPRIRAVDASVPVVILTANATIDIAAAMLDAMEARFKEDSERQPFLTALRRESSRLNAVMRDLLDFGRPQEEPLAAGALAPVVEQSLRACSALAEQAGVRLEAALEPGLKVSMNAARLAQVFQNLVENATHHSPPGGAVRVETVSVQEAGRASVECRVLDGGAGFRKEDLPHLFEPFFTRRPGGTGLGLSIVQRIVVQHGGEVRAENRPAGGAQVTVRLPAL